MLERLATPQTGYRDLSSTIRSFASHFANHLAPILLCQVLRLSLFLSRKHVQSFESFTTSIFILTSSQVRAIFLVTAQREFVLLESPFISALTFSNSFLAVWLFAIAMFDRYRRWIFQRSQTEISDFLLTVSIHFCEITIAISFQFFKDRRPTISFYQFMMLFW